MTMCMLCALRAMIAGTQIPYFNETMSHHRAHHHPDPLAESREKGELMATITRAQILNAKGTV